MKIVIFPLLAVFFALEDNSAPVKTVKYCGKEYIEIKRTVYLKDEGIKTVMVQVKDPKTKKFVFGYFESAIRNDTNFIYSRLSFNNDTIICTDHRLYKITRGYDSSLAKYICTKKGLLFYSHQVYADGNVKITSLHNILVDKY